MRQTLSTSLRCCSSSSMNFPVECLRLPFQLLHSWPYPYNVKHGVTNTARSPRGESHRHYAVSRLLSAIYHGIASETLRYARGRPGKVLAKYRPVYSLHTQYSCGVEPLLPERAERRTF